MTQRKSQEKGNGGDQHGFREKLSDQLMALRSRTFPDADLFSPFDGTRRAEIDKVDSGDQQDKYPDHRQDTYIIQITGYRRAIGRMQVDGGQGLQPQGIGRMSVPKFIAFIFLNETRQLC